MDSTETIFTILASVVAALSSQRAWDYWKHRTTIKAEQLQEEQKESTLYRDDLRTQVGELRQKLSDAHERREKELRELNEKITNLTKSLAEMVVRVEFLEKENTMLRTAQG